MPSNLSQTLAFKSKAVDSFNAFRNMSTSHVSREHIAVVTQNPALILMRSMNLGRVLHQLVQNH